MKISQKLGVSIMFAFILVFASMFIKIIPCQSSPNVPNPQYSWSFCDLNPDTAHTTGMSIKYLSYTDSLKTTYITTLGLSFIVLFLVLSVLFKSKKE